MIQKTLEFKNPFFLGELYNNAAKNLNYIEKTFHVTLTAREANLYIEAKDATVVAQIEMLFAILSKTREQGLHVGEVDFQKIADQVHKGDGEPLLKMFSKPLVIKPKGKSIVPKSLNQRHYLEFIQNYPIVFGIGPAGTGKTYLAVAAALHSFFHEEVRKIILTRPAVEAGEALGFLPGDLREKILPYLRPLYDAMHDIVGPAVTQELLAKELIEIAPLAYMRGRTLSNAFIILDEAQNTTSEQMMMLLTRMGKSSKIVVTGDITQIDLPRKQNSGLKQAIQALSKIKSIKFFYFDGVDIVRHPVIQEIIEAYEHFFNQ